MIFEDGTDLYWARSRVLEILSGMGGKLPQGVSPQLGPDATGVGWALEYALVDKTGKHSLAELRTLQDWQVQYQIRAVPGVAEVAAVGGFVKQYQVTIDPNKLQAHKISINQVVENRFAAAIRKSAAECSSSPGENTWCAAEAMFGTPRISRPWPWAPDPTARPSW